MVGVAQLVRALDCGSRGWGFKSPRSPHFFLAPVAQWTERRTSDPLVAGSNPAGRASFTKDAVSATGDSGPLAQLAEHLTLNQGVTGSIPVWPTKTVPSA